MTEQELLKQIKKHLKATGLSRSAFGRGAVGDSRLITDIENGRSPSMRTVKRIEGFIRKSAVVAQ